MNKKIVIICLVFLVSLTLILSGCIRTVGQGTGIGGRPQCSDGYNNNDGDGYCDFGDGPCLDGSRPGDPGCDNRNDDSEVDPTPFPRSSPSPTPSPSPSPACRVDRDCGQPYQTRSCKTNTVLCIKVTTPRCKSRPIPGTRRSEQYCENDVTEVCKECYKECIPRGGSSYCV